MEDANPEILMIPLPGSYTNELLDALERQGASVRSADGFMRILSSFRTDGVPDVIHLHFLQEFFVVRSTLLTVVASIAFLLELCVAKAVDVPVVWTVHNVTKHESEHPRIERVVRHLTARLCDDVLVHCDAATDIVSEEYRLPEATSRKIRTVPHGHYLERYPREISRDDARQRLGFDDDDRVFIFFGHVRPYKNVPELIRTFAELDAENVHLLVVGNPLNDDVERRVSRLASETPNVRAVLEFVPDEEVQVYMHASDVVICPYTSVLTSGSVILGMTFERPVIAPQIGCVGDMLTENGGFPYDPDDEDGLSKSLRRAATASLDGMGRYNYERIQPLDWDSIARQLLTIYRDSPSPEIRPELRVR